MAWQTKFLKPVFFFSLLSSFPSRLLNTTVAAASSMEPAEVDSAILAAAFAGDDAMDAGNYSEALAHFEWAIAAWEPRREGYSLTTLYELLILAADCLIKLTRFAAAFDHLDRVALLISDFEIDDETKLSARANCAILSGDIYFQSGRFTEAIAAQELALSLAPSASIVSANTLVNLANIYCAVGDGRRGLQALQRAEEIYHSSGAALPIRFYFSRGRSWLVSADIPRN